MTASRELRLAVLLSLSGAGLVLLAASRTWLSYQLPEAAPLPSSTERLTGALLVPGARPLALVGLAGIAALFATRRTGRVLVGALVLAAGTAVVVLDVRLLLDRAGTVSRVQAARQVSVAPVGSPGLGPWPWVCLLAGLLLVASGALVAVRGRTWSALSSSYEVPVAPAGARQAGVRKLESRPVDSRPVASRPVASRPPAATASTDRSLWDALDRGEDPTG